MSDLARPPLVPLSMSWVAALLAQAKTLSMDLINALGVLLGGGLVDRKNWSNICRIQNFNLTQ